MSAPSMSTAMVSAGSARRPPIVRGNPLRVLRRMMFDPIGLVAQLQAEHGDLFTLEVPFGLTPPFTFFTTRKGYSTVLRLDPDIGRNGPVIERVPALSAWSPRARRGPEHLQAMLLAGRAMMAQRLRHRPWADVQTEARRIMNERLEPWSGEVDLSTALVGAIHETSVRLVLGDELTDALGPRAFGWIRTIANAVDAARAAVALSPAARLLPEYRATRRLCRKLLSLVRQPDSDRFEFIAQARRAGDGDLPPEDVAWLLFFAIWNAVLYTGTYGVWSLAYWLASPNDAARLHDHDARFDRLVDGVVETMRMHPISWQLRSLSIAVTLESGGQEVEVPAGHFLTVSSYHLNRDPELYEQPERWDPSRFERGAAAPLLFGTGPFSCVAQHWVKRLLATCHETILDRFELELVDPLPPRVTRVHLLYPGRPLRVRVTAPAIGSQELRRAS